MYFKFKKDSPEIGSSEPYYDLFERGYINPSSYLESEQAAKVNDAIATVLNFMEELEEEGLLEIS